MKVQGKHYRTIWLSEDNLFVKIIDQRWLPHEFRIETLKSVEEVATAIKDMHIRGAGLIGATAAYGMYLAALETSDKDSLIQAGEKLKATRPTAVNLSWAVNRQLSEIEKGETLEEKRKIALETAKKIADEDAEMCKKIGEHGVKIIEEIANRKNGVVNILTHCNAGWLAFVDYGSATAPIYEAFNRGIKIHVYVDETRPRNQGARLTAWELGQHGVPHTIIADNTGGHLMQHGMVDMAIVGTDRTTYTGDVANKIGTYLKALAAKDNGVPFYVALPSSTFDWNMRNGMDIPIEQRGNEEVKYIQGEHEGEIKKVLLTPKESSAANYAFDVTPARLVTGLITERGICEANEESIKILFPENMAKGYEGVKFRTEMKGTEVPSDSRLEKLSYWCKIFHDKNLAPPYEGGSYGNLSFRIKEGENSFIITASSSSLADSSSNDRFATVERVDLDKGIVYAFGKRKPSSEAILHWEIYNQRPFVNAIFHGHCEEISANVEKLGIIETKRKHPYGTLALVKSVIEVLGNHNFLEMKGHPGFLALGKTIDEAGELSLEMLKRARS